tara:strand:+ start:467 stop:631 length:165 start_codon:yes stop_codon:yes gene_type:complete
MNQGKVNRSASKWKAKIKYNTIGFSKEESEKDKNRKLKKRKQQRKSRKNNRGKK